MKTYSSKFKIALLIGAASILAIFITRPAHSQEAAKKESGKTITLKIISDDNGKTTIIDTTMEMADSAIVDSITNEINKVIIMGKGGRHARIKMRNMPEGFNYNFEIPPIPENTMALEDLDRIEWEGSDPGYNEEDFLWQGRASHPERRIMRFDDQRQMLSDILGDIPMDRVASYSIKDRKGGKRIVIDLNDAPLIDRPDRVIVIREPARMKRYKHNPERQVKVIVNTDDDEQTKVVTESSSSETVPPPPPPPPPPAKPEKTKPKK